MNSLRRLHHLAIWGALLLAGCNNPLDTGGTTSSGAPSDVRYLKNPAFYPYGQEITANVPSSSKKLTRFSITPDLPDGLSFNANTGAITGTPTTITAEAVYLVEVGNDYGSNFLELRLAVTDLPPTIAFGGSTNLSGTVGTPISGITPTLGGGATTACTSVPALPAGLTLSSSCVLGGTPTVAVASPTQYSIIASNPGGSDILAVTLTIADIPPAFTYSQAFSLVRGVKISNGSPSSTGGVITSCSSSPALPAGISLSGNCTLGGTPTAISGSTSYTITANNSGGSNTTNITLDVHDVAPVIAYSPSTIVLVKGTEVASILPGNTSGTISSCSISPVLPAGLQFNTTTCEIRGTPTAVATAATYTVTASNAAGPGNATMTLSVKDKAPTLAYINNPYTFTNGVAITPAIASNSGGSIVSCSASPALPAGLSISNTTCTITGTPTVSSGVKSYTVTATNSGGSATTTIMMKVNAVVPNLTFAGSPYTFARTVTITPVVPTNAGDPPTSCTSTPALPAGLSLDNTTCTISGTPTVTAAGANYAIKATNAVGASTKNINITVTEAPPAITIAGSPFTFTRNSAITTISAVNTGGTITSCSASPSLPTGLSINNTTCAITGTPTIPTAAATYTITATNAGGSSAASISITVNDMLPAIAYAGGPYTYSRNVAIMANTPTNTGGTVASCSSSPALPTGLSISNINCSISGTPSIVSPATSYTITATNSGGSVSVNVSITVNDAAPVISYAGSPFAFTKNSAITAKTPTASGGTITSCASSPVLPGGLSLSNACVITGTPNAVVAATDYTITATNSGGTGSTTINIAVNDIAPTISIGGSPFSFTKNSAIAAINPTLGGGAVTSCSSSPSLPAGLSIHNTTCAITGTPTAASASTAYTITASNSGGNATANINITVTSNDPSIDYLPTSYNFTYTKGAAISALTPNSTGSAITSCSTSPTLPAGLSINNTTCSITGTPTALISGQTYTVTASNSFGSSSAIITITVNDAAPALAYAGSPFVLTKNSALGTQTPSNTGGDVVSCVVSPGLPAGLSLSPTCVLSGTPTAVSSTATYTITATNSGGSAAITVDITVNDIVPTLSYMGSPFTYTVGVAIPTVTPTIGGGAITSCTSSPALPAGLSLNGTTCVVTGTPSVSSGATAYTITATNSGGTDSDTINITVNNGPPILSYSGSPFTFTKNSAISTVNPTNGGGTITSCAANPALPAGLSLSNTCVITGTPSALSGVTSYTITATNGAGTSDANIDITVNDQAPAISFSPAVVAFPLRVTISSTSPVNSGGTIVSCSSNPTLPTGLAISATCVITGTPTSIVAANDYTITATNTGGSSSTTLNLRIKDQPQVIFHSLTALSGAANGTAAGSKNIWKASMDGVDLIKLTQNSNAGLDSVWPSWNADGTNVVYASLRALNGSTDGTAPGSSNIWSSTGTGASPLALSTNNNANLASDEAPVYSPDGTKIAFASKAAVNGSTDGTASLSYNIFIMNADGTGKLALTANTATGLDSRSPVFSPDGTMIYFSSRTAVNGSTNGTAAPCFHIWRINSNGTGKLLLSSDSAAGRDNLEPAVSPDGNTIAWASRARIAGAATSSYNIWTMNYDGSGKSYLTAFTAANLSSRNPKFSPDGTEIVFSSRMNVNAAAASSTNIWKMDVSGLNQVALTQNNAANLDSDMPSYSPDGSKIAFQSRMNVGVTTANSINVWVMNSDGTGSPTALTTNTNAGLDSLLAPFGVWFAE